MTSGDQEAKLVFYWQWMAMDTSDVTRDNRIVKPQSNCITFENVYRDTIRYHLVHRNDDLFHKLNFGHNSFFLK